MNILERVKLILQITAQQQAAKNAALQTAFENEKASSTEPEKSEKEITLATALLTLNIMEVPEEAHTAMIKEIIIEYAQEFLYNTLEFLKELALDDTLSNINIGRTERLLKEFKKTIRGWEDSETDAFIAQNQRQKDILENLTEHRKWS